METNVIDLSENVWSEEQEKLLKKWADYAASYRWLHDRTQIKYSSYNNLITIPVIVLSSISGTASIGISGLASSDPNDVKYGQIAIGIVTLFTGVLSTLGSHFRFAQKSENHRLAAVAWKKFNRNIIDELSQKKNVKIRSEFIESCHQDLDKLIQQFPEIPDDVMDSFEKEFEKQIVSEMTINIKNKKKILRDELLPELDIRMNGLVSKTFKEYEEKIKSKLEINKIVTDVRIQLANIVDKEHVIIETPKESI